MNATVTTHPLAHLARQAQAALDDHKRLTGPSKADTIAKLDGILSPAAVEDAAAAADKFAEQKAREARAAFLPVLEAAKNKLQQLRPHYDGTMGMSIDKDLEQLATAIAIAKEASK